MPKYLEERISRLEDQLENCSDIVRRLTEVIMADHSEDCEFKKALKDIGSKIFSDSNNILCLCKNKHTHNKKCLPRLEMAFEEEFCDCGFYEVSEILIEL